MIRLLKRLFARLTCVKDRGEWSKHYCNNDCDTCGYNK